jgi:hypothetical protein
MAEILSIQTEDFEPSQVFETCEGLMPFRAFIVFGETLGSKDVTKRANRVVRHNALPGIYCF